MEKINDKIYNFIKNNELEIEKIMKKYNQYITTILNRSSIVVLKEDQEEIILDVYLTLWNNKEKLDINKSMTAYIAGITKNLILKKMKKQKTLETIEKYEQQLVSIQNIELDYVESQKNKLILDELEKMKKENKEIFLAYYFEGKKIKEIAIMFKISESKVKSKLFRTRNKLRKILKEGGHGLNG